MKTKRLYEIILLAGAFLLLFPGFSSAYPVNYSYTVLNPDGISTAATIDLEILLLTDDAVGTITGTAGASYLKGIYELVNIGYDPYETGVTVAINGMTIPVGSQYLSSAFESGGLGGSIYERPLPPPPFLPDPPIVEVEFSFDPGDGLPVGQNAIVSITTLNTFVVGDDWDHLYIYDGTDATPANQVRIPISTPIGNDINAAVPEPSTLLLLGAGLLGLAGWRRRKVRKV